MSEQESVVENSGAKETEESGKKNEVVEENEVKKNEAEEEKPEEVSQKKEIDETEEVEKSSNKSVDNGDNNDKDEVVIIAVKEPSKKEKKKQVKVKKIENHETEKEKIEETNHIVKSEVNEEDAEVENVLPQDDKNDERNSGEDNEEGANNADKEQEHEQYDKSTDDNAKEVLDDIENLLNDDEFIESLNVVDTWDGEEEVNKNKRRKVDKDDEVKDNKADDREKSEKLRKAENKVEGGVKNDSGRKNSKSTRDEKKRSRERKSRDKNRSNSKDRKGDKKSDRRDPSKSNKDIERDKIRLKKNVESKILEEKEKAIKKILDSDTIVPPGTESEAIEKIVEKQNSEEEMRRRRSRDRRSVDKYRSSPGRSKRSPYRSRISPPHRRRSPSSDRIRHRSPLSPDRNRRSSPRGSYRRRSPDKYSPDRRSIERRRRMEARERDMKYRRSRSTERRRSRSMERRRRYSRSPDRRENRWRSRSRSRSPTRRSRKRSPFINEIARQLSKTSSTSAQPFISSIPSTSQVPSAMPPMGIPNSFNASLGTSSLMNPSSYAAYDPSNPTSINYDLSPPMPPMPPPPEFSSGAMFNSGRATLGHMTSPQPVPPPSQTMYNHIRGIPGPPRSPPLSGSGLQSKSSQNYGNDFQQTITISDSPPRDERIKTPEPPVISDSKLFEKTSLSSLLEASVSAKESSGPPRLYPGFKPEILKNCERALQELPLEDPRLKMTGRFFFDPLRKENQNTNNVASNSILLRKNVHKIYWDEDVDGPQSKSKNRVMTHQKICQTDEPNVEQQSVQATVEMVDAEVQVNLQDLMPKIEEKRMTSDLEWNKRMYGSGYEFGLSRREADLRENMNCVRENWMQPTSPRMSMDVRNYGATSQMVRSMDYGHREAFRNMDDVRDLGSGFATSREEMFKQPVQQMQSFNRSMYQQSTFSTPMDEYDDRRMDQGMTMMRESEDDDNWRSRGYPMGNKLANLYKMRASGLNFQGHGAPFGGASH